MTRNGITKYFNSTVLDFILFFIKNSNAPFTFCSKSADLFHFSWKDLYFALYRQYAVYFNPSSHNMLNFDASILWIHKIYPNLLGVFLKLSDSDGYFTFHSHKICKCDNEL